jgi:hypothetical protein
METSVSQNIADGKYKNPLPFGPGAEAKHAYRLKESETITQFWKDVREEFGLKESNWKHERMLSLAWEHGHSSGLHEVLMWVEELYELVV